MKCSRCLNEDPRYFYYGSKGYYCRKCIKFKRILYKEEIDPKEYGISGHSEYTLKYALTIYQKDIADKIIKYINEYDILLYSICGSGKTEMVMPLISEAFKKKKKICYAIARREVVLELSDRFQKAFINNKVVKVCEGYNNDLYGDLIVCTTHQLYRYPKTFDILILDEVDAFPFKGDTVLNNIALNSLKEDGHIIYSTATIDNHIKLLMQQRPLKVLSLKRRPHNKPLIEPKVYKLPNILLFIKMLEIMHKTKGQMIIFVESIKICKILYFLLKRIFNITYVYSSLEERNENIKAFKNNEYQFIIATSILERGITIDGVDVLLYKLYKGVFDKASIIQMTGRVGRSFNNPYGHAYILVTNNDEELLEAIKEIKEANEVYLL